MIHNVVFQNVALNKMQMLLKIIYFHLVIGIRRDLMLGRPAAQKI